MNTISGGISALQRRILTFCVMAMTMLAMAVPAFAQDPGTQLINDVSTGAKALLIAAVGLVVAVVIFKFAISRAKNAAS